ncbi:DUF4344 domain-containing metallopeptidase [Pseudomonas sp. HK3]
MKKISYSIICLYFFTISAFAESEVRIVYEKPFNKYEVIIEKEIRVSNVVENVAVFINEKILLSKTLYFKIGGEDGPLYDPTSNEVIIPYTFIQEVKDRFKDAKYSETGVSIADATMDAVMHTLFHELAHALIFTYKLPVLGKEEDAADSLANVLLIEYFESGAEIAISAADLFDLESEDVEEFEEEDFWGEHSLDAQRFYSTLCHVYGSEPKEYRDLKKELGFSDERAEICIDEYDNILRSWLSLLEPYFKHNK